MNVSTLPPFSSPTPTGILSADDLSACIESEWNPCRCGFHGGGEIYVNDVLNVGISPRKLIEKARANFVAGGGRVYEDTPVDGIEIYR
jgi:lycopene cyclase CruP